MLWWGAGTEVFLYYKLSMFLKALYKETFLIPWFYSIAVEYIMSGNLQIWWRPFWKSNMAKEIKNMPPLQSSSLGIYLKEIKN